MGTKIVRILATALLAYAVAKVGMNGLLFLVLWPALYMGWSYLGRRRAARGLTTILWRSEQTTSTVTVAKHHSGLRRGVRAIGYVLVAGLLFEFILIGADLQKAKEARSRVHKGMTVGEVLHSASAGVFLWANSDAPQTDPDHPRALNLSPGSESGTFSYFDSALNRNREVSETEALALLHQRLGDGYPWRLEYFFPGRFVEHFSFRMVFDKDGRVQEVTSLNSFD